MPFKKIFFISYFLETKEATPHRIHFKSLKISITGIYILKTLYFMYHIYGKLRKFAYQQNAH